MADGILAYPGDGGPAIELSAGGMTVPSYLGTYSRGKGINTHGGTDTIVVSNMTPGAQLVVIPKRTMQTYWISTSLVPGYEWVKGINITGNTIKISTSLFKNSDNSDTFTEVDVFEIPPRTNMNYGITIQNTQNWLEVTSNNKVGYCVYKTTLNLNSNTWTKPQIERWDSPKTGTKTYYDKARCIVFAHWDNPNMTLDWDGNTLTAWGNVHTGKPPKMNISGVQIAIFVTGYPAQPHQGGVNIFNAKGGCTFSTARAPFLFKGIITTNKNPVAAPAGVSKMMVPLCRLGVQGERGGGWSYAFYGGMRMAGNKLWSATGKQFEVDGEWTDHYAEPNDVVINIPLPVIDAANYF